MLLFGIIFLGLGFGVAGYAVNGPSFKITPEALRVVLFEPVPHFGYCSGVLNGCVRPQIPPHGL